MKKLYVQVMVALTFAAVITALNVWALLSLNPVEYYFTLRGFLGVAILYVIECVLMAPPVIALTKEDKVLNEILWVKKES